MNKSLMATFIGRQVDNGDLDLTASVLTALRDAGADDKSLEEVNPSLTLQHLLSMSTGFDFSERYLPGDDVTDMLYRQSGIGARHRIRATPFLPVSNGRTPVATSTPHPSCGSNHCGARPTQTGFAPSSASR